MRTNSTRLRMRDEYNTQFGSSSVQRRESLANTFLLGIEKPDGKKIEPEIVESKGVETVDGIV